MFVPFKVSILIIIVPTVLSALTLPSETNNYTIQLLPENLSFKMCLLSKSLASTLHITTVFHEVSIDILPTDFFQFLNIMIGPVMLISKFEKINNDCVLIITQNVKTLRGLFDSQFGWNYRRYYIIILVDQLQNLEPIFEILWIKYQVINVLISYLENLNSVFIFNPFISQNKIKIMNQSKLIELEKLVKFRMDNMNGNPVHVSMFQKKITAVLGPDGKYHGLDQGVLDIVAQAMNFIPIIRAPADGERYGYKLNNGSFVGVLGDVLYNRSIFAANGMFIKDYKSSNIEFASPFWFDQLCLAAPKSEQIPQWMKIFLCFSQPVWWGILVTYVSALVFWCTIHKIQSIQNFDCSLLAIKLFSILLALACHIKLRHTSERLFMMSSIAFGFVIANSFQGSLVNILSNNAYKKDITTMEEFDLSGLHIFSSSQNLYDTFDTDDNNPTLGSLDKKFTIYNKSEDILKKVADEKFGAALGRRDDLKITILQHYMKENVPLIHIVEECPRSYYLSFFMLKKSPYLNTINNILSHGYESGIFETSFMWNKVGFKFKSTNKWKKRVVFELEHLFIAFRILLIGICLSTLVFVVEIGSKRYFKKCEIRNTNYYTGTIFLN